MKGIIRAVAVGALAVGLQLGVAPVALAVPGTTPRADEAVDVWCDSDPTNFDGTGPGSITPGDSAPEGGNRGRRSRQARGRTSDPAREGPGRQGHRHRALQRDGRSGSGMVLRRGLRPTRATGPVASISCRMPEIVSG